MPGGTAATTEEVPSTGHTKGPHCRGIPAPSAPSPRPVNQASGTHTPLAPGEAKPGSAVPRLQSPRPGSLPVYRQPPAPGSQASPGSPRLQGPDVPGWSTLSFSPDSPSGTPQNPRLFPTHPSRWKPGPPHRAAQGSLDRTGPLTLSSHKKEPTAPSEPQGCSSKKKVLPRHFWRREG